MILKIIINKIIKKITFRIQLFDSVAPDVNIISFSSAPIKSAIYFLAVSTAFSDSQPYSWEEEWGFPKSQVMYGNIASKTLKSKGVVAYMSK